MIVLAEVARVSSAFSTTSGRALISAML